MQAKYWRSIVCAGVDGVIHNKPGVIVIKPFHLSFVVSGLNQAKKFYVGVLGCNVSRDTGEWLDIIFFGHQITMHQERQTMKAKAIDHFGPILEKAEWLSVAAKLSSSGVDFQLSPTIKDKGTSAEHGKYRVNDPAGNLIEFKYYGSFPIL
jgi:extradiol dioxygenase family protein